MKFKISFSIIFFVTEMNVRFRVDYIKKDLQKIQLFLMGHTVILGDPRRS